LRRKRPRGATAAELVRRGERQKGPADAALACWAMNLGGRNICYRHDLGMIFLISKSGSKFMT
jgi:hypothetical protein